MKSKVIINFKNDEQAKAFFNAFDAAYTKQSYTFICEMLSLADAGCVASSEEMPGEDYYMIEIE